MLEGLINLLSCIHRAIDPFHCNYTGHYIHYIVQGDVLHDHARVAVTFL